MKRYEVIIEDSAQENVRESYDWGCRVWGKLLFTIKGRKVHVLHVRGAHI
jgi:hypothetical protein